LFIYFKNDKRESESKLWNYHILLVSNVYNQIFDFFSYTIYILSDKYGFYSVRLRKLHYSNISLDLPLDLNSPHQQVLIDLIKYHLLIKISFLFQSSGDVSKPKPQPRRKRQKLPVTSDLEKFAEVEDSPSDDSCSICLVPLRENSGFSQLTPGIPE